MQLELVTAVADVATLLLLSATAVAGFVQLRHMRAGNELAAVLAIERDFRTLNVQRALSYVQNHLAMKMEEAAYRAELDAPGYIDPRRHPEMVLCNWFNRTGELARTGFVKEALFLDSFGRLVTYYWLLLCPVIAVLRRTRGAGQYAGFEYLAYRAQQRQMQEGPVGSLRSGARSPLADPWRDEDTRLHRSS